MIGLDSLIPDGSAFTIATVVATPGDGTVAVNIGGTELLIPHLIHYVPGINDAAVILQSGSRRYAIGAITNPAQPVTPRIPATAPSVPPPPKPTPPTPKPTTGTRTFLATSVACFRGGKWRTDTKNPHQGDWGGFGINTGAWFYGTQVHDALAGADVLKVEWYCVRIGGGQYGGQVPTVYTMPHAKKPSGTPTLLGSGSALRSIAVNKKSWMTLPASLGQQLIDGTANGIATFVSGSDPYIVFGSLSDSRSSGALRITYRK